MNKSCTLCEATTSTSSNMDDSSLPTPKKTLWARLMEMSKKKPSGYSDRIPTHITDPMSLRPYQPQPQNDPYWLVRLEGTCHGCLNRTSVTFIINSNQQYLSLLSSHATNSICHFYHHEQPTLSVIVIITSNHQICHYHHKATTRTFHYNHHDHQHHMSHDHNQRQNILIYFTSSTCLRDLQTCEGVGSKDHSAIVTLQEKTYSFPVLLNVILDRTE